MAITTHRLTYEDLELIPQEREGDRHELIDGELIVSPSPAPVHQIIVKNLTVQLALHIDPRFLGTLMPSPIDVKFSPDNVLIPDLVFIARDRPDAIGDKAVLSAPDLIIEILSPGSRRRDLGAKRALYARFGVAEYWIVDPAARSVRVLSLTAGRYEEIPIGDDRMVHSRVLPELALRTEQIFVGVF